MPVMTAKDVQAKAQQALLESPVYALRDVVIERDGETLVLIGKVSSFYHKQLAQELVRQTSGAVEVINSIDVQ